MQRVHGIRKPGSALARAGRSLVTAVCLGSLAAAQFLVFATTSAAPVRAASDPVLMAAGDIGCDPTTNTPANCPMNNTAALINSAKPGYVLALGDIQYTDNLPPGSPPTPSMYLQGYDSAWGQIPASVPGVSINPTAGNHDWGDPNDTNSSSGATLANYISYFNAKGELRSGVTASTPWYSFDIPVTGGSWHVIVLDNECGSDGGCGTGSPQETFLRNDLAAHPNVCTIAAWHRPRFSSGAIGNRSEYAQFWTDLANAHASVVLAGSDHDYERFNPQTPAQVASSTGIAQYVVGTGGAFLPGNFGTIQPNSAFRDAGHWGVLKMTLHATSYDHAFVTTSGATEDAGTVNCSNPPPTQPSVSGLNPTTGPAGGGNAVVISGTNFTGGTSVKFGTVAATGLTVNNASQITVTAPAGTPSTTVDVTVTTPNGTSTTNASDRYAYQTTQPQVNSVSPPSGPAAGGTSVTISGINLSGATAVKFGATPAASITASSATQVTAVSPSGTDQTTVDVTVTTPADTSATGPSDRFTYGTITTPPAVAAVTPSSGPSTGGNSVSITGSGFTGASAVRFGTAAAASFTVNNAGLITAIPPAGTANLLDVTVTNPAGASGTSTADQYSYTFSNNGYAVSLSATTTAPAVGGAVNLTATANKDVGPTPYGLGIVDVTTETELVHGGSGTTLSTSVTQASAVNHRYMGYISNANMTNAQANSTPIVVTWGGPTAAPTVTGVNPGSGTTAGGTSVVITSTGFTGASAVRFGSTPATAFTVNSATQITATSPAAPAGQVDVTVTAPSGTSALVAADRFTFVTPPSPPAVTGVSPASGTTAGGTSVVISGTSFSGSTGVSFGTTPAASFIVNSAGQITATSPAEAAGPVDVTVTNLGGTSPTGAADTFTFVTPPPAVTGVSPATGPTAGGTAVTITGANFTPGTPVVSFGTTAGSVTAFSATSITVTAPAGAATVDVRVTTPAGTSAVTTADRFTYADVTGPPTVTGVTPISGPSTGGTSIVITGTNFASVSSVKVGSVAASSFTVNSATQITATAPAGTTTVDVTVVTAGGTSARNTATDQYTYTFSNNGYAATIATTTTTPAVGAAVNITVTANKDVGPTPYGLSIIDVTTGVEVFHGGSSTSGSVSITQTAAGPHRYVGFVSNAAGTNAQAASVPVVVVWAGTLPAVSGVSPSSGPTGGGTAVTITGANFTGATAVRFGTANAAGFTVNAATQIVATAPPGSGTVDVTVVTPSGTSSAVAADRYTYATSSGPVVAGIAPASGSLTGGTAVAVTGSGFTGATAVRFGTAPAASFTVNSPTSITAVSPAGAAGTIEIGVTTGAGTSESSTADWYTFSSGGVPPVPNFDHVFTIVMENTSYNQIVGNLSQAPYFNSLLSQYGLATNYTGVAHPSLPNYLALTGGTTFGVTTDCNTCFQTAPNIAVDRVEASGRTWKAYMESMPASCTIVDSGEYAVRHDPFAYYTDIQGNPSECAKIVPSTALSSDLGATSTTPNYAWITPNLCDDIHDCSLTTGDTWLSQNVPAILDSPAFTGQNSVLFITFDEDDEASGNHIATLAISNDTPAGAQSGTTFDHYSLLRTIENAWNLPPLSSGDAAAASMSTFFGPAAPRPAVLGVSPTSGPSSGGQQVTITGANLGSATGVAFGGVAATSFTVNSATSITATSPGGSGTVDVTVANANGASATSAADQFTYAGAPTVTGLSPNSGPPAGGTSVTITGTGFTGGTPVVRFGTTSAGITSFTPTSIVATSPVSAVTGTVDVTVTTPAGTSATSAADRFTYTAGSGGPPAVTGTNPISGPSAGGTSVDVTGTNLLGATSVQFGSVAATSYTVNSATQITAFSPAGTTTVDVTVTTPLGTSPRSATDEYTYTFANNGYAATISASTTAPAAGGSVVLSATSNKDVGPTPYGISIFDVTTGTELVHIGSGSTASVTVSQAAASTHRYVAMICNANGANAQAASTPVVVTWR